MWLVGSKLIRSNVTIPTISFSRLFFYKWRLMCRLHCDIIILSSLPRQFSTFEVVGGGQPCIFCFQVLIKTNHSLTLLKRAPENKVQRYCLTKSPNITDICTVVGMNLQPTLQTSVKSVTLQSYILVNLLQITVKLGSFNDFKAFFQAALTGFR